MRSSTLCAEVDQDDPSAEATIAMVRVEDPAEFRLISKARRAFNLVVLQSTKQAVAFSGAMEALQQRANDSLHLPGPTSKKQLRSFIDSVLTILALLCIRGDLATCHEPTLAKLVSVQPLECRLSKALGWMQAHLILARVAFCERIQTDVIQVRT